MKIINKLSIKELINLFSHLSVLDLAFPVCFICESKKKLNQFIDYLLLTLNLCNSGFLFIYIHILSSQYISKISISFISKLLELNIIFEMHLVDQLLFHKHLLLQNSLVFFVQHLVCFFWSEMRLIILLFQFLFQAFALSVLFYLHCQETKIFQIVFSS